MLCLMQNHMVQAFANSGNAIKPVSFIRDLKSKSPGPARRAAQPESVVALGVQGTGDVGRSQQRAPGVLRPPVPDFRARGSTD